MALASLFQGRVVIERPAHLGLLGMEGGAAKVLDPEGKVVLRAAGVRARADVLAIVHSVVLGKGPMSVPIDDVHVDYAEVVVDAAKDGPSAIAAAFARRLPIPPRSPDARGVELAMDHITVHHAWVHGQVPGTPPTDADVDDVVGSVHLHQGTVRVDVTHYLVHTRGAPRGLDAEGTGDFHLTHPSQRYNLGLEGSFAGTVGGIGAAMKAALDGKRVDATLDVPRAPAERVRAIFADAPANAELGLRIDAHGELPLLDVEAQATLGAGTMHAKGPVTLAGERRASLAWSATSLDLRAFSQTAPESNLQGKGTVDLTVADDASVTGRFTADVGAGTVSGKALPGAMLHGTFDKKATGLDAHAEGHVDEAGAPTDVVLDVSPDGPAWELDGTAHAKIPRLDAVTRLGTQVRGAADVRATYKVHTKTGTIDATVHADVRGLEQGAEKIGHAAVTARVTGKLASPAISTTTKATDLLVGTYAFPSATLTTHGTTKAQHVDASFVGKDTPDIKGTAEISLGTKTTVRDVDLSLKRNEQQVAVRVPTIRFGNGDLLIEDAVIRGLGAPVRASLDVREKSTVIRARSRSVSLARLGHLLRFEDGSLDGRVDFDIDLLLDEAGAHGKASAALTRATIKSRAATGTLTATAEGHRWGASAKAALAGVGTVELTTTDLALGTGGPLRSSGWQGATGTLGVRGTFDLAELATLAPKGALGFQPRGTMDLSGVAERTGPAHDVSLNLAALTHALEITTASGRVVSGIDAQIGANLDGSIGGAAGVLVLTDASGQVARLDVQSDAMPYRELWATSNRGARLLGVPLVATLTVPPREVGKLPAGFALKDAHGTVQLVATLSGTVASPSLRVGAAARDFASRGTSRAGWLSADVSARYDGKAAHVDAVVHTPKSEVLEATVDANAAVADILTPKGTGDLPWDAAARVKLLDFPLSRVAFLADHDVRGKVTGDVALDGLHDKPRMQVKLQAEAMQVGSVVFPKATLNATVDEKELRGTARLEQSVASTARNFVQRGTSTTGFGELAGSVGLTWGHALVPAIDASRPMEATLATKRLRAAVFLPFVDEYFGELDGFVDSNAIVSLMPGAVAPTVIGMATFEEGILQVTSMGTELRGASGRVTVGADGTVRASNLVAHGLSGTVTGNALARLDGFRFTGGTADFAIAKDQAVPVDLKGVQLGDVWGNAHLSAAESPDHKEVAVTVDIPVLHAELPLASTRSVRDRDELPNVHVGVYSPGRFTPLTIDGREVSAPGSPARPILVTVNLGREVDVKRGTSLSATLEGSPQIAFTDKAAVSGQIRLTAGTLLVQGKKFEIEKGTVSFVGKDASDPLVIVTAGWSAPDGTRVFADFVGPLKSGKVTLRSEPSRPNDEILALILFGSADQSAQYGSGDGQTDAASTRAGGAAGTFATQGLSEGLDELTGLQIAGKIDTSNPANPKPEVEVQLARTISLQLAYVLGTPPPGANPDKTFATIGWRFAQRWSLETTFGDSGSSFADVVWQLRY